MATTGLSKATSDVIPLLESVRPPSLLRVLLTLILALPIWAALSVVLLFDVFCSWRKVWARKDRSADLPDPAPGFKHEFIYTNGIRLHAVSPGRQPSKPLMLMLHGFPESWYSWRRQMVEFAADYDVVALDMRGYGLSDKPKGMWQYALDILVADVEGAIQALGHSSCTLVAHDWGGALAWVLAALRPAVVDRLVVLAAFHLGLYEVNRDWDQFKKSWYMLLFQAPWLPELVLGSHDARFIERSLGSDIPGATPLDIEHYKQAWQRPGAATAAINYYRALLLHMPPAVVAAMRRRIRVPTLVLWGDRDPACALQTIKHVEQVVPDIKVVVLERCGHWVQQEQPEKVNHHMRAWLTAHGKKTE